MTELSRVPATTDAEAVLEIMHHDGGVVIEGVLSASEVAAINDDLESELGPLPEGNWAIDAESWIADFQGYKTKRLQHCVRHSRTYRETYMAGPVMPALVSAALSGRAGTQSLFASQAIEIWPGEKAQVLHRDAGPFYERLAMPIVGSPELLVNSLLALTDVTEEMGATRVIPASHLWPDPENMGEQDDTIPATMRAGDVLLLGGRLIHGGGANTTRDRPRRIISTTWSLGFFKSEEAWHEAIPLEEARTYPEVVQRYLGLYSPGYRDEEPGFLWRVDSKTLQEHLGLVGTRD